MGASDSFRQKKIKFFFVLYLTHPHICRHTYCSQLAAAGVPPKVLQVLMGHANISTTIGVYTHTNIDDIRAAVEQAVGCNSN